MSLRAFKQGFWTKNPEVSTDPLDRAMMIQIVQRRKIHLGDKQLSVTEEELKKLTKENVPEEGVLRV